MLVGNILSLQGNARNFRVVIAIGSIMSVCTIITIYTTYNRKQTYAYHRAYKVEYGNRMEQVVPNGTQMDVINKLYTGDSLGIRRPMRLWYTRVPKCGSSSMLYVTENACKENKETCHQVHVKVDPKSGRTNPESTARKYLRARMPTYGPHAHVFFINFTKFGLEMPEYISIIRDPLEHRLSTYYYLISREHTKFKNMTIDQCIQRKNQLCLNKYLDHSKFNPLTYFCGHEKICRRNTKDSLALALANLERYFGVVGIIEDFKSTVQLLEYTYPTFFYGASIKSDTMKGRSRSPLRSTVSDVAVKTLMPQLSIDYMFYNYVRKRLYKHFYAMESSIEHE